MILETQPLPVPQIDVEMNGEPWLLRTELRGCSHEVVKAAGVAVPQRVQSR